MKKPVVSIPVGLPWWLSGKESVLMQETWVQSLDGEDPWRRAWQPTSVFLENPHDKGGQQSIGSQTVDKTEVSSHTHTHSGQYTELDLGT